MTLPLLRLPAAPWSCEYWQELSAAVARQTLRAESDACAAATIGRPARAVLRAYSTSFFIVTRFLPPVKRARVEAVYAAVRYPDEIVDTFPLPVAAQLALLDEWEAQYERGLTATSIREAVRDGVAPFVALFSAVVRACGIPPEHYRAFLGAMRLDATPRPFETTEDLIESYIYGSAIVVGYFLAHVYGPATPADWSRTLRSARHLAIALQLTNFMRDVSEDQRRGRLYLPLDLLRAEGIAQPDVRDPRQHAGLSRVLRILAHTAEEMYRAAAADLDAFSSDSRSAIRSCIDVYRQLNDRIAESPRGILHREQVPFTHKLRVLPSSKYWKLPLAYLS